MLQTRTPRGRAVGEWPDRCEETTAAPGGFMREEWRGSLRRWPECSSLLASRHFAVDKGMASVCTGPGRNFDSRTAPRLTGRAAYLDLASGSRARLIVRRGCWSCPGRRG